MFLPHHALVTAPSVTPSRWMLVLHGILGSGTNFRSFARRLAAAHPAWGFVLPDLRLHGQSLSAPPPHTLESAAADLARLADHLSLPITAVMGHSFGGKVALSFAFMRARPLEQLWVLDASPGTRRDHRGEAESVIAMLRALPDTLPSRERFLDLVTARGFSMPIAEWLAMNVRREGDAFRFRLDLDAISLLLDDYFTRDLWPILEHRSAADRVDVVIGGRSEALDAADRARLAALGARDPEVRAHLLPEAGHWVHVDAPDELFTLVASALGPT